MKNGFVGPAAGFSKKIEKLPNCPGPTGLKDTLPVQLSSQREKEEHSKSPKRSRALGCESVGGIQSPSNNALSKCLTFRK